MAWEWSHTNEAYYHAECNVRALPKRELLTILREWAYEDRERKGTLRFRGPQVWTDSRGTTRAEVDHIHPNFAVGKALGLRHAMRHGRKQDGMDMGFHLVYELSGVLYGSGYPCQGKGKCPSNVHRNSGENRNKYGEGVIHTDGYAINHRWL